MPTDFLHQEVMNSLPEGGAPILVAVSGGVDSVVLLHVLRDVAVARGIAIEVAHLDHRIRPESGQDAAFVAQLCREWTLPCRVESCDVPGLSRIGGLSLEMAGRQARREFLQRRARDLGARQIALAHHQDDQLETFMIRLLRGSGQTGLSAMRVREGLWWRPLLGCSRAQLLDYARQHRLQWVEDKSNQDTAFLRNRLRHEILPRLHELNPQFSRRISELIGQNQLEEDFWREQVAQAFDDLLLSDQDGLSLSRPALLGHHPALRARLVREALRRVRNDLLQIGAVHIAAVDTLIAADRSQTQLDLPGCWVARRYERVWFRDVAPENPEPFEVALPVPGELSLPDGRLLAVSVHAQPQGEAATVAEFALHALPASLRVRSWRRGDRFEPFGMTGQKKLKRFFGDNRVELEERMKTALVVADEKILWVVGRRRSRHAIATPDAGRILRLELLLTGEKRDK